MAITGEKRENVESSKKVGLFAGKVLCINPNVQEYKEILGIELKEDSKATEYLGESKEGNITLRINVWLSNLKGDFKVPVTFFLENKQKENKTEEGDGKIKKYQFINSIGSTSWAPDRASLPNWFKEREHRIAFVGEDELYKFVRTWLGGINYRSEKANLDIDANWKGFLKGKVNILKDQIGGEFTTPVVVMATVKTLDKDDGPKEYQSVWNKEFLPEYSLKQFRLHDYGSEMAQEQLKTKLAKTPKELKAHERFVLNAIGEYGIKDFYKFQDLKDYDPSENIIASGEPMLNGSTEDLPF